MPCNDDDCADCHDNQEEASPIALEAREKFDRARALVEEGKYAEALDCYLFAFDNRERVSGWGGVGLSYIPAEIAQLGKQFPPARQALIERRDTYEEQLLTGNSSYKILSSWTALNRYLEDSEHERQIMRKLQQSGKLDHDTKEKIVDSNFDYYLTQRNYDLLGEFFDHFGWLLWLSIGTYEADRDFPQNYRTPWGNEFDLSMKRHSIRKEGIQLFEVAVAIDELKQAEMIRKRVLSVCPGVRSNIGFIYGAVRAGQS